MGAELLFETNNQIRKNVRWKLKNTGLSSRFVPSGGRGGVCQALTIQWLRKSIHSGGIRSANELPEDFQFDRELHASTLAGVIQAAYTIKHSVWAGSPALDPICSVLRTERSCESSLAHLGIYGLLHIPIAWGDGTNVSDKVIDHISSNNGHFMLDLRHHDRTAHVMGFRHDGQMKPKSVN